MYREERRFVSPCTSEWRLACPCTSERRLVSPCTSERRLVSPCTSERRIVSPCTESYPADKPAPVTATGNLPENLRRGRTFTGGCRRPTATTSLLLSGAQKLRLLN
ncbi:hypothetical protein LSAT2_032058 [Lamellibrachia satsuma]|nr:hypothetical protein LSAT2_032058 [Lamellibrachia satsuma]